MKNASLETRNKIDLVKAFMQFYGGIRITNTCYNYDKNGGIQFTGYEIERKKPVRIVMDKYQVEAINDCETIDELHECYMEMEYFGVTTE